jgi:hypothetical protein
MLGFRFAPRFRDLNDQRFWRADLPDGDEPSGYGPLDAVACNKVNLKRIVTHWPDMLRVAGSLITNQVRAYDLLRMFGREGHPTPLGAAFAEYGRIDKTMHLLAVVDPVDDTYRRLMNRQLTVQESRHRLARAICHGGRGQIRQAYREGQEDQLAAPGLVLNAVVLATWMPPSPNSAPRATTSRTRTSPASPRSRTGTSTSWAATFSTSRPAAPAGTCARCATRMRPSWTRTTGPRTDLGFPRLRVCHPRSLTRCASP